jgi:alkaline phosphatase D
MTPSVTSSNLKELLNGTYPPDNINEAIIRLNNPHIRFFNSEHWGYSVVEFTRNQCIYTAYDISKSQNSESVAKRTLRRVIVPVNQIKILNA